jgi:hypothetical protein
MAPADAGWIPSAAVMATTKTNMIFVFIGLSLMGLAKPTSPGHNP